MRPTTLCFIINDKKEILLGRKKRGLGAGKPNGFGGKREDGETFRQCAVRELFEETSLLAKPEDLEPVAILDFQFPYNEDWTHVNYVYLLRKYEGLPMETEEMEPFWTSFDKIPYDTMWAGDEDWIPQVLNGELLKGTLVFGKDNDGVMDMKITKGTEIPELESVEAMKEWLEA